MPRCHAARAPSFFRIGEARAVSVVGLRQTLHGFHGRAVLRFRNRRHLSGLREGVLWNVLKALLAILWRQERILVARLALDVQSSPVVMLMGVVIVYIIWLRRVVDAVMVVVSLVVVVWLVVIRIV